MSAARAFVLALCATVSTAFLSPTGRLACRPSSARPRARTTPKALLDVFAASTILSAPIDTTKLQTPTTVVIAAKEKIVREGLYGSYEVEVDNGAPPAR